MNKSPEKVRKDANPENSKHKRYNYRKQLNKRDNRPGNSQTR
jgi:hypothetical protein